MGIGTRSRRIELDYSLSSGFRSDCFFVCWFFLEFFGWISIDYFVKIFFFTNVSFFEEVGTMRCELDRFRFHVSFNVFCSVRVIDDL